MVLVAAGTASAELKVGDPAPAFSLEGSDGKTYKLEQFKGKKAVVLAWFPKAFTKGCTKECKSLRANSKALKELKVAYFTASTDDAEHNKNSPSRSSSTKSPTVSSQARSPAVTPIRSVSTPLCSIQWLTSRLTHLTTPPLRAKRAG